MDWDNKIEELADIEDIMNEDEPDFEDLLPTYNLMNPARIQYLEKWLDLSLLEEFADHEKTKAENYKQISTLQNGYTQQEELEKLKSFEFELESYDELKIQLKQAENSFKADSIYIKFSKVFENESDGLIVIEKLSSGLSVILRHPISRSMLSGILISKNIRKKKVGTAEFYMVFL